MKKFCRKILRVARECSSSSGGAARGSNFVNRQSGVPPDGVLLNDLAALRAAQRERERQNAAAEEE